MRKAVLSGILAWLVCAQAARAQAPKELEAAILPPEVKSVALQLYAESPDARRQAAGELAKLGEKAAPIIPYLGAVMRQDPDGAVSQAATDALAALGPAGLDQLTAGLQEKDPPVRRRAAEALG